MYSLENWKKQKGLNLSVQNWEAAAKLPRYYRTISWLHLLNEQRNVHVKLDTLSKKESLSWEVMKIPANGEMAQPQSPLSLGAFTRKWAFYCVSY